MSRTGCWRLRRTPSIAAPSARQPSSSVTKCSSARISCATSKEPSSKPRRLQTSDLRQWLEEGSQRRPTPEDALTNVADAMSAGGILEGLPNRRHEVIVRHVAERPDHLAFRAKELIIRSGFNVYPAEVEAVLNSHEMVVQSAVIGRAVPGNEEVVAFVKVLPGAAITAKELMEYA